jgi:RNA polymerase sigma-70 factor, ECF subfamily
VLGAAYLSSDRDGLDWSEHPDGRLFDALAGDPTALGELYDRYGRLVYGLAVAILANQQEAEDLTHEVFLTLCTANTYDPTRGSVGGFLTTLTRSRAIDRLRGRTRSGRLLREHWHSAPPLELPATPLDQLTTRRMTERVRASLAELSENERRALELAYYKGLTQAEIADDLGVPLGTVKSWCRRGLLNLKRALGDLVE